MPSKKESAPGVEVRRASVNNDKRSIPQDRLERGGRAVVAAFALMLVMYIAFSLIPELSS